MLPGTISSTVISRDVLDELKDTINAISTHGMARIIAASTVRVTKKSRSDKSPAPEWMDGLTRVAMFTANVGHDYQTAVRNQVEKSGMDPQNFQAEASNVSENDPDSTNGIIRQGLKDPNQKYVRVYVDMGPNKVYEERYYNAAGEDVTDKIDEQVRADFFPKKYGSEKQMLAGAAKEVKPREYKAENILYFQMGGAIYNVLSKKIKEAFELN